MIRPLEAESSTACPFVNHNDHRCGGRLSIARLDEAFRLCFGVYHACPIYHQLRHDRPRLTDHGHQFDAITTRAPGHIPGGQVVQGHLTIDGRPQSVRTAAA